MPMSKESARAEAAETIARAAHNLLPLVRQRPGESVPDLLMRYQAMVHQVELLDATAARERAKSPDPKSAVSRPAGSGNSPTKKVRDILGGAPVVYPGPPSVASVRADEPVVVLSGTPAGGVGDAPYKEYKKQIRDAKEEVKGRSK